MIHHRPQGFDDLSFRPSNLVSHAALDGGMVLILRLPFGRGSTGIAESAARIRIDGDGNIFLGLPPFGIGEAIHASIKALIAAELKVAVSRVDLEHWVPNDALFPHDMSMIDGPEAIQAILRLLGEAAAAALKMLTGAAAHRWDVSVTSCRAHDGEVIHRRTWRKLGYGELAVDAAYQPIPRQVELRKAPLR